jgi:hypothetical protein
VPQSAVELWGGSGAAEQAQASASGRPLAIGTFNSKTAQRFQRRPASTQTCSGRKLRAHTYVLRRPKVHFDEQVGRGASQLDDQPARGEPPRAERSQEDLGAASPANATQRPCGRPPHRPLLGLQLGGQPGHRRVQSEGARQVCAGLAPAAIVVRKTVQKQVDGSRGPERCDQAHEGRRAGGERPRHSEEDGTRVKHRIGEIDAEGIWLPRGDSTHAPCQPGPSDRQLD